MKGGEPQGAAAAAEGSAVTCTCAKADVFTWLLHMWLSELHTFQLLARLPLRKVLGLILTRTFLGCSSS